MSRPALPSIDGLRDYGTGSWAGGDPGCDHAGPPKASTKSGLKNDGRPADRVGQNDYERAATVPYRDVCGKCGAQRTDRQIGLEATPDQWADQLVRVFRECRRVLKPSGTLWVECGTSYASGGNATNRAPARPSAPAYGSDGTEPQGSQASDSSCPDPDGGPQDATPSHHGRTEHTAQPHELGEQHDEPTDRGTGTQDCAPADVDSASRAAPASTTPSSSQRSHSPQPTAAASPSTQHSDGHDARECARISPSRKSHTASPSRPSVARTADTEPSGTAYIEYKPKDLILTPFLLAEALRRDGWYLRQVIIWGKPNAMPESARDRCTTSHSYVLLLSKKPRYWFDSDAIAEPADTFGRQNSLRNGTGAKNEAIAAQWHRAPLDRYDASARNARSVWTIPTQGFNASAVGYDSPYRASADCPVHGLAADPENWRKAAHDEPQDRPRYRIDGSDARHALKLAAESASSSPHNQNHPSNGEQRIPGSNDENKTHGSSSSGDGPGVGVETHGGSYRSGDRSAPPADSSDSPHLASSPVATARSTESRKTDPAPATTRPCTSAVESPARIGDTSASLETGALFDHMPTNRTGQGDSAAGPSEQTPPRTARKCTCVKDTVDHFATWPEALAERIVKAGCPEWVCGVCGAPRVRIVEHTTVRQLAEEAGSLVQQGEKFSGRRDQGLTSARSGLSVSNSHNAGTPQTPKRETVGWSDCGHNAYRPGTILDPFMGAGTTALVARRLGRSSVGVELNEEYAAMCARRLGQQSLLAEGAA